MPQALALALPCTDAPEWGAFLGARTKLVRYGPCPVERTGTMSETADLPAEAQELLARAAERARANGFPYAGALLPAEAQRLRELWPEARLVDVRTRPELEYVGRVPGAAEVEWQRYPDGVINPAFLDQLAALGPTATPVLFLCRSGARSHAAASASAAAGWTRAYNVLEGFEGNRDAAGHRSTVGGWRFAGLPWVQG